MSNFPFTFICLIIISSLAYVVNGHESKIGIYELKRGDFILKVTNYGARIISVILPDKNGKPVDVVLGYDSIKDYQNDTNQFGAIVGRVANRIGGAQFTLNGTRYKLYPNDGNNTLHGGRRGFSKVTWEVQQHVKDGPTPFIVLSYNSFDGEEGFPGNLSVTVTYALLRPYKIGVMMKATALNKATPVNLAQHSYWNLGGHNSGDILSDKLRIFASRYTPTDNHLIPTGKIASVKGTPYDFLKYHKVGSRISALSATLGYNLNYVLDGYNAKKHVAELAAIVRNKRTGIEMKISTNAPGMVFYTANYVRNVTGKGGYVYQQYSAYCFETQGFPDAVNHPNFPSTIVNPGEFYRHDMLYEFQIKK